MSEPHDLSVHRHPPIREQVANILRHAIVNLDFRPGELLIERELCERTGASRPSVREALRQLEAEGLVESRNGRGTIVRVLSPQEVENVYEVRAELEGLGARLFCERASAAHRDQLRQALQALTAATGGGVANSAEILAAQYDFYSVLFAGAQNQLLDQLVQGLQGRVAQLRASTLSFPGRAEESSAEFARVVQAIDEGDAVRAEVAAVEHVRAAGAVMKSAPLVEELQARA